MRAIHEGMKRKNYELQKVLIGELISTDIPEFLRLIQKVLIENGGKYLVGSDVSLDIYFIFEAELTCVIFHKNIFLSFFPIIFQLQQIFTIFLTVNLGGLGISSDSGGDRHRSWIVSRVQESRRIKRLQNAI